MGHKFESSLKSGRVLGQSVICGTSMENLTLLFRQKRPHEYTDKEERDALRFLPNSQSAYPIMTWDKSKSLLRIFGDDELWL